MLRVAAFRAAVFCSNSAIILHAAMKRATHTRINKTVCATLEWGEGGGACAHVRTCHCRFLMNRASRCRHSRPQRACEPARATQHNSHQAVCLRVGLWGHATRCAARMKAREVLCVPLWRPKINYCALPCDLDRASPYTLPWAHCTLWNVRTLRTHTHTWRCEQLVRAHVRNAKTAEQQGGERGYVPLAPL